MKIVIKPQASHSERMHILSRLEEFGCLVRYYGESLIGATAPASASSVMESIASLPGVDGVTPVRAAFKFSSREFRAESTVVTVGECSIGGGEFAVIAGPCSVESEDQILRTAEFLRSRGVRILRGGAFKPRTSPYDFQGLGERGLRFLDKARQATGMAIVTEVMCAGDVALVAECADMLQIGARNMQNTPLLIEAGRCSRPVLLKRGPSASLNELLLAAEYVVSQGNSNVILCERGIRGFDTAHTRNVCDIAAIPVLQSLTHLPVMMDPSHATGRRYLLPPMCRAGIGAGAAGLLIEVHHAPPNALSDGDQSLDFEEFRALQEKLAPYQELWVRERSQAHAMALMGP